MQALYKLVSKCVTKCKHFASLFVCKSLGKVFASASEVKQNHLQVVKQILGKWFASKEYHLPVVCKSFASSSQTLWKCFVGK